MTTYLLERSRVIKPAQNERTYHAFYQTLAGAEPQEKARLRLEATEQYDLLARTGCTHIGGIDDAGNFAQTMQAMETLGIDRATRGQVLQLLSAVLHLGNLQFETAEGDGTALRSDANRSAVAAAAEMLLLPADDLVAALTTQTVRGQHGEIAFTKNNRLREAHATRDSLMKQLYASLFGWLVGRCRDSIMMQQATTTASCRLIGILDIYGFESFEGANGFEQLCINFANEKMQQFFVEAVFVAEQARARPHARG